MSEPETQEINSDSVTPAEVGEGWRLLRRGERIEPGDEVHEGHYDWKPTKLETGTLPSTAWTYRRRITPTP